MKIEKLNAWLTLGANIAVVIGIIFLAIEVRQNSQATNAATRSHISSTILNLLDHQRHPLVISALRKSQSGEELTYEEIYMLDNQAHMGWRHAENVYYQYRKGLFDENEFLADQAAVKASLKEPYRLAHWRANRRWYSEDFRNYVDGLLPE